MIRAPRRSVLAGLLGLPACAATPPPAPQAARSAEPYGFNSAFAPDPWDEAWGKGLRPLLAIIEPNGPGTLPLHVSVSGYFHASWVVVREDFHWRGMPKPLLPDALWTVLRPAMSPGDFLLVMADRDPSWCVHSARYRGAFA